MLILWVLGALFLVLLLAVLSAFDDDEEEGV